jgi:hypothetical protein
MVFSIAQHHVYCGSNAPFAKARVTIAGWTFAGSDEGGRRAADIYTLIVSAKLNDVDPQTWLADVLARLHDHAAKRITERDFFDLLWGWADYRTKDWSGPP